MKVERSAVFLRLDFISFGAGFVLTACLPAQLWGQWTCGSVSCTTSDNVIVSGYTQSTQFSDGIGIVWGNAQINRSEGYVELQWAPGTSYDGVRIFGSTEYPVVFQAPTGNVGVGTAAPAAPIHVAATAGGYTDTLKVGLMVSGSTATTNKRLQLGYDDTNDYASISAVDNAVSWKNIAINPAGGNVGIGTTTPAHLLHVAGTIGAEEVIVSSSGADYVFGKGYRLAPLSEVADFVKENHHLPDIPSAEEVEEKGVGLGDMQTRLLAKVEELTLHLIEADKENRALLERVERLERGAAGK